MPWTKNTFPFSKWHKKGHKELTSVIFFSVAIVSMYGLFCLYLVDLYGFHAGFLIPIPGMRTMGFDDESFFLAKKWRASRAGPAMSLIVSCKNCVAGGRKEPPVSKFKICNPSIRVFCRELSGWWLNQPI